ncbi:2-succinyl-5-enolpyruvyl-6-hydroxy-3-cyclohexene-1-carboxylic-acid synthase [Arthrobacter agilis]|uniref:2-succinyl-5-enolpyruvyl-6-hydroxy-3- cyclohexene-1-carboxylic-acid synthase n=1 Tax=Arthrobacter agilis TaxID=37921 RepID=UPI00277F3D7D|nr:2-succinyl-5-enolpyruvyl-6-hydroxy-3-cyclohexene-1-carboxylic-acid synthase [Arthrobacter agilis]MDQ0735940.1 2-succinyl-5-enolpyruvyl-6-hydroxy-3-cyclohexene-1-carboxylate synthase [Arthrobacter agilis]
MTHEAPEPAATPEAPLDSATSAARAVRALVAGGVVDVVVAPGSRSAPLAYALAEAEAAGLVRLHVRIDERSGAFTALGLALGARRPAAVVTTSGTAVGELLPAVMEANHAAVPLVVVSADRPAELRGTGANQTTVQPGLFGVHVRAGMDVPAGDDPGRAVTDALRAAVGAPVEGVPTRPPGPVHLNLAFRDPLVPGGDGGDRDETLPGDGPAETPMRIGSVPTTGTADLPDPAGAGGLHIPDDSRTVVVAGHGAGELAAVFAAHLGLPLLAEPSSNARFGSSGIAPYRLLLEHLGPAITRVVTFGRPTLSRPVTALLARPDVEHALYLPEPVAWFEEGRRPERIIDSLPELLTFAGRGEDGWLQAWRQAGATAEAAIQSLLAGEERLTGLHVADAVWEHTDGNLVLGSSNPIRDVDLVAATDWHPLEVFANRGLAGIDGTVSTATGIALAAGIPTRVLLGDVTFLHDAGGLLLGAGEAQPDLQIVVLNDGGGGIFGLLEHGADTTTARYGAAVERLFGTPHTVDIASLAAAHGVPYERAGTLAELDTAMERPITGRSILEVRTERTTLRTLHARIRRAVADVTAP